MGTTTPSDRRAALEAAIDDDPFDPRGYAVLADHLQELGDPRGELIALQLAGRKGAMEAEAGALFERLRGVLEPAGAELGWAFGYVRRAAFTQVTATRLRAVLDHPSCRFLAELRIASSRGALAPVLRALATSARPSLRTLAIGLDGQAGRALGDCAALWAAVPRLAQLELVGTPARLGRLELPRLGALSLVTGRLEAEPAEAIARAAWPALQRLAIGFGEFHREALTWVRQLITRTDLPALAHLALTGTASTDALIGILAASPLTRQLRGLDLSRGALTDAGAAALIAHRDAFAHLTTLDVRHGYLTPAAAAGLVAALPAAAVAYQQRGAPPEVAGDDDDDYDRDLYDY